jgi:urease gamma subunit
MDGLSTKVGELVKLITEALVDNAKQGAQIASLEKSDFRHDAEIQRIQQNIAELMRPTHKRSA